MKCEKCKSKQLSSVLAHISTGLTKTLKTIVVYWYCSGSVTKLHSICET
jgi:hypothetical protein